MFGLLDSNVIKLFSYSFILSIKVIMLTYIKNANNCWHFDLYEQDKCKI